jgi:hypothetical protein
MVFLGGAVLANIVSDGNNSTLCICSHRTDGRQRRHVDIKAGVARARLTGSGEAGRKIMLACNMRMTWISVTIDRWQTKALLAIATLSYLVSLSQAVFLANGSRCTITSPRTNISCTAAYANGPGFY